MNGTLTRVDASALANLSRALIGFDRIFHDVENRISTNYPPYNVIKNSEHDFEIEIAVAGFEKNNLSVEVDQDQLIVKGCRSKDDDASKYLYRGLAARDFEKSWTLADHMEVKDVELTNGILSIKITRIIPEALKPRIIDIKG
jgi:molecular chaperone IbpA